MVFITNIWAQDGLNIVFFFNYVTEEAREGEGGVTSSLNNLYLLLSYFLFADQHAHLAGLQSQDGQQGITLWTHKNMNNLIPSKLQ